MLSTKKSIGTIGLLAMVFFVACHKIKSSSKIETVTINNMEPRRDVTGQIIDAHDGCLQFFDGQFYLYGTAYGSGDGYGLTNRYVVYSSPDLGQWKFEGEILPVHPPGIYYRPYVVFNQNTRKYVLWYNWFPKGWNGQEGIAVSDNPIGPFSIVRTNALHNRAQSLPGDGSLFVDDDGKGYYIFTAIGEGYAVRVLELTSDYEGLTGMASGILAVGCEAPLLFRRNDIYYALSGPLCAFCPQGSEVEVFTAASPLGPFKAISNINRRAEPHVPNIPAQETWVAKIPTGGEPAFIWMADRWQSFPDGIKGHEFQFWSLPLQFETNGDILPIRNVAQWHIARTQ
jgi:hypothetical protein